MLNTKIFYIALLLSFAITLVATKQLIPFLLRKKMGQKILEIGPNWHKDKDGTPTMGGISFVLATIITLVAILSMYTGQMEGRDIYSIINILIYSLFNALVGAIDDIAKIRNQRNMGLTPRGKLILQSVASVIFLIMMKNTVGISTLLKIPFADFQIDLGPFYYVLSFLLLCGITNAVNLTDGVDGLASTCVLTVGVFFSIVGITKIESIALCTFGSILIGTTFAFLIFNLHPAKIFMGDTGSLFFGGMIVGTSFLLNSPLLVLMFGFCFVFEAFSVIFQVIYFKLTKGKRFFKMAPFHHHLEKSGFSEIKVVSVFGIIGAIFCLVAYFGV